MSEENISKITQKNLLDLAYQKYLQYLNASIVILFTYLLGLMIALFANQINYNNLWQLLSLFLVTSLIVSSLLVLIAKFKRQLSYITQKIRELNY